MNFDPVGSLKSALRQSLGLARLGSGVFLRRKQPPVGSRPGTLALTDSRRPRVTAFVFQDSHVEKVNLDSLQAIQALFEESKGKIWLDVQGFGSVEFITGVGQLLGLHPLTIEDMVNTPQRPKLEVFDQHLFVILRMLRLENSEAVSGQLSVVFGSNWVATFQEDYADVLAPVSDRLCDSESPIRKQPVDYLAYAIIDTVIDGYFAPLEQIGSTLERLEVSVFSDSPKDSLAELASVRAPLLALRRPLMAQQELLQSLSVLDHALIHEDNLRFFRDPFENVGHIVDAIDSYRELARELGNTQVALMGQRTNDAMQTLTVVASLFVPLTFIAGLYGMNFTNLPGAENPYGFYILIVAMIVLSASLGLFFYIKRWIGK